VNGPFIRKKIGDGNIVPKEFSSWAPNENKRSHYDVRDKNNILFALT